MDPFYALLEDGVGVNGELYSNIIDYFYFCQIRSHGENVMDVRAITGKIPIAEISTLMRAIGYFPSEEEILNMTNEIRYKYFMTTGVLTYDIDLEDFIRLYINHRPLFPLNSNSIESAFAEITSFIRKSKEKKKLGNTTSNNAVNNNNRSNVNNTVSAFTNTVTESMNINTIDYNHMDTIEPLDTVIWSELIQLLTIEGEALTANDLMTCLTALMGEEDANLLLRSAKAGDLSTSMNASLFAENILGFETA